MPPRHRSEPQCLMAMRKPLRTRGRMASYRNVAAVDRATADPIGMNSPTATGASIVKVLRCILLLSMEAFSTADDFSSVQPWCFDRIWQLR